jgi:hypothetical protein
MVGHLNLVKVGVRDHRTEWLAGHNLIRDPALLRLEPSYLPSILAGLRYGGIGGVVTKAPQLHESIGAIAVCDPVRYIHS